MWKHVFSYRPNFKFPGMISRTVIGSICFSSTLFWPWKQTTFKSRSWNVNSDSKNRKIVHQWNFEWNLNQICDIWRNCGQIEVLTRSIQVSKIGFGKQEFFTCCRPAGPIYWSAFIFAIWQFFWPFFWSIWFQK